MQVMHRRFAATTLGGGKRYASTKISVQLLKDFPNLGYKGEVVQVTPGRMRNELHVNNGAAYVLKGEPLRLPLRTRESINAEKAADEAKIAEQKERQRTEDRLARQERERNSRAEKVQRLTNLHFGSTAESTSKENTGSAFIVESALRSLPKTFKLQKQTRGEDTGFLESDFTSDQLAQYVTRLTGTQIPSSIIKFSVKTGRKEYTDVSLIDHIGSYRAVFTVPGGHPVFFDVSITPSNKIQDSVSTTRPVDIALPEDVQAEQQQTEEPKLGEEKPKQSAKQFEWENDLITNMEEKLKK